MKKYSLYFLTMTMALSSGAAFATGLGPGQTEQVVVSFTNPSGLSHNINAVSGLEAKRYDSRTKIADGVVTVTEGPALEKVAVRWVNGTLTEGQTQPYYRTIVGANPNNSIDVSFGSANDYLTYMGEDVDTNSVKLMAPTFNTNTVFNYVINLVAGQTVAADSYTMQISAHKFVP
ncbi:hypothetical protein KAT72_19125 [Aeromonas popoffii]|uniref:Saf-pilin pilus formation protein domain-containing protein n=1 Tax=Aeromonas popoffii TaxID=70856 RepID=A0ABS5GVA6_9GAMM|nr:hypothetical protein [Aeromonas popoffii]MBR7631070.1 hypothetical protein [Aeromonas popoffii]